MTGTHTLNATVADDIRTLRSQGVTDDAIIKGYKEWAPHNAADIDTIVKQGATASSIVDSLITYPEEGHRAPETDPQDQESAWESSRKALQHGASSAAVGLGRTAVRLGELTGIETAKDVGEGLTDIGKSIAPENYKPAGNQFFYPSNRDKGVGGYGWRYAPRMLLETVPGLVADIGAGALAGPAGFIGSNAARSYGPAVDARVENNGGREASGTDYAMAAGSTALQAYLSRVGVNPALSSVTKGAGIGAVSQLPSQVAKAAAVDAAAGTAGNVVDQVGVKAGTDKGLTLDAHEALGAGVASGAVGGAVRGVRGIGDVINAGRYADMDPVVAERLANRFDRLGIEPKDPQSAFSAVKATERSITTEMERAKKDLFSKIGEAEGRKHLDTMNDTEILLNGGYPLSESRINMLRESLGSSKQAQKYVEKLEDHSALNELKSKGRYDEGEGYFAGGLSGTSFAEDTLNPLSWVKSPIKRAMGSTAAAISLGSEAALAKTLLPPLALGKVLALQSAAYGGLRAIDGVAGSRNPVEQLTNRFRTEPGKQEVSASPAAQGERNAAVQERPMSTMARALTPTEKGGIFDAVSKAAESAVEADWKRALGKGSQEKPEAASEAPRASGESIDPKTLRIEAGGYKIDRPHEGIANVGAYVTKTKSHMMARAKLGDDLEAVSPDHTGIIRGLVNKLNLQSKSYDEAASHVEDAINSLPWDRRSAAWDAYLNNEAALRATYKQ
jgi:hypothetical protein